MGNTGGTGMAGLKDLGRLFQSLCFNDSMSVKGEESKYLCYQLCLFSFQVNYIEPL